MNWLNKLFVKFSSDHKRLRVSYFDAVCLMRVHNVFIPSITEINKNQPDVKTLVERRHERYLELDKLRHLNSKLHFLLSIVSRQC